MMKKTVFKFLKVLAVAAFWVGIWYLLYFIVDNSLLFPSMHQVVIRLVQLAKTYEFYQIILKSVLRIFIGLIASIVLGILIAIPTARFKTLHSLISPLMTILKATPIASFIILLLLWIGRDVAPAIISVCVVLPIVWTGVETGILHMDKKLIDMAKAYNMSGPQKIKYIYIPQISPYFISSIKSSIGLAWKAGIAAEVLSLPLVSIGKQIYESKLYLETVDLFAWTLVAVVISVLIEKLVVMVYCKISKSKRFVRKLEVEA